MPVGILRLGVQCALHVAEDDSHSPVSRDLITVHHVAHVLGHLVLPMVAEFWKAEKRGTRTLTTGPFPLRNSIVVAPMSDIEVMVSPNSSTPLPRCLLHVHSLAHSTPEPSGHLGRLHLLL